MSKPSNLAHAIEALKADLQITQTDIVDRTGIDPATFSRLRAGVRNMTFDDVRQMCLKFPEQSAGLLRARLLDECGGPGGDQIHIGIVSGGARPESPPAPDALRYFPALAPAVDQAVRKIIAALPRDAKLRTVIQFIGDRLNCCQTEDRVETYAVAAGAAVLNELHGGAKPPPGQSVAPGGAAHYGKGRRKRAK
jgi:DNA-binding Xre family transcriptional regulator